MNQRNFSNLNYKKFGCTDKEERIAGGFLLPFLTGAVISAPFWYLSANNKCHNCNQYPYYYPYQTQNNEYPYYYPYPPYPQYK